jgi:hypothetical protein
MNVARRASPKTLRPIRLRIAETLAVALLALVFQAPGVGAFEALDGRLQVHGFYAMQLRGMSADWKDQFDMTQWYNVLNLEIELDLAPDGFEPFLDLASSYVRAEVRFDCIYYNGCDVVRPIHTYGNDSRNLPGRLSGARQRLATMGLGLQSTASDVFTAPAEQPDGGETVAYVDTTLNGSRVLPSQNPAPITEISPFNVLADLAGIDRYRGDPPRLPEYDNLPPLFGQPLPPDLGSKILLPDDPFPYVFPEYISDIHAGAVNGKGGGGFGLPVTMLAPWRPKDYAAPTALLFDKINPFDNTKTTPQASASYYNASMFDSISDKRVALGLPSYARGDMEVDDPSTWYNNVLKDLMNQMTFASLQLKAMEEAAQVAGFGNSSGTIAAPTGFGANPLAPIPVVAAGAGLEATGYAPQGLFLPSKYLRAAMAAGDLSDKDYAAVFKKDQLGRAFNHGWSQSRTYELKEAYLDLETFDSRLWLRIGKQNIVWGKTELFRTTDNFNPQDLSLATLPGLEESRIPLLAIRGVYSLYDVGPLEDVRFEVALNIDEFQGLDFGYCGEPYAPNIVCQVGLGALGHGTTGIGVAGIDLPPSPWDDVKGLQGGARIEWRYDRFSFALSDYYGYAPIPYIDMMTLYDRNVDIDTGRLRTIDATGPCIDGTQEACLTPGPIDFNDTAANDLLLADPRNALDAHPANLQLFAVTCASTVGFTNLDPGACGLNVFGSPTIATSAFPTLMIGEFLSSVVTGGALANDGLVALICPDGCPEDPTFLADDMPLVLLNRDANDDDNAPFGGVVTPCMTTSPMNAGLFECGNGAGSFFSGIRQTLAQRITPEQEALLGCGPFFGTSCDLQGIDLLNTEGSVLVQSFTAFDGTFESTPCQVDPSACWTTTSTLPQPGTLNFLTGEEGTTPTASQILGGPVATRYNRALSRVQVLPGARRVTNVAYDAGVDGCIANNSAYCALSNNNTGAHTLDHPYALDATSGAPQAFASELAAASWNLMVLLATIDPEFDVLTRTQPGICSWATPHLCAGVRAVSGIAGLTRNIAKASGNGKYGRRTLLWHGGGEVTLEYMKRNVLGLSVDFAEDETKSNWAFEFSWIPKQRVADSDSWTGTTDVQDFNLSVSMDRPTFIRFLNSNRTFFFNSQLFFQYRAGYKKSMPSDGPFNFLFTFAVSTGYHQDRVLPTFVFVYDVNSQSGAAIPQVTYRVSSAFSVNFGVAFFWGAVKYTDMPLANLTLGNRGGSRPYENGTYNGIGIVRERDEIFFRLRYTF